MAVEVTISEHALQSMVLAASEAYAFGKDGKREPVETYAHLWGYRRQGKDTEHLHVDRISVCVSAETENDGVEVFTDVIALQDDILKHWSPHVSLLGDFHTHPYESWEELRRVKGWQFSKADIRSFLHYDDLWKRADGFPISLVMAVCQIKNVHEGWARHPAPHRGRFDIGQYRFSISAGAGLLEHKSNRRKRRFSHTGVTLLLGQYFHNKVGSRIGEE